MTKDHIKSQKPNQKDKTATNSSHMALDDMGIPILEEIVSQNSKDNTLTEETTSKSKQPQPDNEAVVNALREQLTSLSSNDINRIAEKVAIKVVTNMTSELKQQIQSQLKEILLNNLDEIVNKSINDITKNK
jgi:DNA-binding protein Fis